jgi:hypothetical protein
MGKQREPGPLFPTDDMIHADKWDQHSTNSSDLSPQHRHGVCWTPGRGTEHLYLVLCTAPLLPSPKSGCRWTADRTPEDRKYRNWVLHLEKVKEAPIKSFQGRL